MWLFNKWCESAERFGFERYDAPVLESEEIYKRKAGEAGEEILDQMYNFVDKEGARVTLRPEMTPTLARMVLNLMRAETGDMAALLPLKWYSIPQCWRFETTQRGRKREHYQWNCDMIGVPNVTGEVEVLALVVDFFKSVGLQAEDVKIKVNSRKVLEAVMTKGGVPQDDFAKATIIVDKLDKIGAEDCKKQLVECLGLAQEVADKVVDATGAETLEKFAEIADAQDSDEIKELQQVFDLAEEYGFGDWLVFDASVVRGLAYYTGIVFEANDRAGELRAICGGGRYDKLLSLFGSKKEIPMLGFGFGDCVIMELLKEKNLLPKLDAPVDYVVAAFNKDYQGKAMKVANLIRAGGKKVSLFQGVGNKVAKVFSYADRLGARRVAFVAPGEWDQGCVRIKDLQEEKEDQKQKDVPFGMLNDIDAFWADAPGV